MPQIRFTRACYRPRGGSAMAVKGVPVGVEGGLPSAAAGQVTSDRAPRESGSSLEREFAPEPASAPEARHFVIEVSGALDDETGFRISALTSELVTNAILHARTPFTVRVTPQPRVIRVTVVDGSTAAPAPRASGPDQSSGRGLRIVEALADDWGYTRQRTGKAVWFELSTSDQRR